MSPYVPVYLMGIPAYIPEYIASAAESAKLVLDTTMYYIFGAINVAMSVLDAASDVYEQSRLDAKAMMQVVSNKNIN